MEWVVRCWREWRWGLKSYSISQWKRRRSFGKGQETWRALDKPLLSLKTKSLIGLMSFIWLLSQRVSEDHTYFPNFLSTSGNWSLSHSLYRLCTHIKYVCIIVMKKKKGILKCFFNIAFWFSLIQFYFRNRGRSYIDET